VKPNSLTVRQVAARLNLNLREAPHALLKQYAKLGNATIDCLDRPRKAAGEVSYKDVRYYSGSDWIDLFLVIAFALAFFFLALSFT
jgi:hypothetical protein